MTYHPSRRKRRKMGVRKPSQIRCPGHLAFVRGNRCVVEGLANHACSGKVEAAHARLGTDGGAGVKPSDIWAIPLCSAAHKEQHNIGEMGFKRKYGINMKAIAEKLASISPHKMKWEDE